MNAHEQLLKLAADVQRLMDFVDTGLLDRIEAAQVGIPAMTFDRGASHGVASDPTARSALGRPDPAWQHELELAHAVDKAANAMRRCIVIAGLYPEHNAVAEGETDGCQSCARTQAAPGVQRWQPPFVDASTVDGALERPMRLCRWCYRAVQKLGRLPTIEELNKHHRGERLLRRVEDP